MLVLRPVEPNDLPQLQQLARDSLVGVTSLPDDSERLSEKIAASCASFDSDVAAQGPENYFFVLEDLDSNCGTLIDGEKIFITNGGFVINGLLSLVPSYRPGPSDPSAAGHGEPL